MFIKDCQIDTDLEILLPDDYVNQIAERLQLYRELDDIENEGELKIFEKGLIDRFGESPQPTLDLFDTIRLRWMAKEIGFEKLGDDEYHSEIRLIVKTGLFGWEYIEEIRIK